MSTLELTALTLASIWLGVLSLAVLVVVRQVGVLTVRLDMARQQLEPSGDGLAVGTPVPDDVLASLPRLREGVNYLLALSGSCDPCREFVAELHGHHLPRPVVALVSGPPDRCDPLISLLPPTLEVVRDPDASSLLHTLLIQTTPFAVEINSGVVSGYAISTKPVDLLTLMAAQGSNGRASRQDKTKSEVSVDDSSA